MYLLLDFTMGPLWSPSDTVSKYTAIRCFLSSLSVSLKDLPSMPHKQLLKVIKGHLTPGCDLHEPNPHSPENVPQGLISSSSKPLNQAV